MGLSSRWRRSNVLVGIGKIEMERSRLFGIRTDVFCHSWTHEATNVVGVRSCIYLTVHAFVAATILVLGDCAVSLALYRAALSSRTHIPFPFNSLLLSKSPLLCVGIY